MIAIPVLLLSATPGLFETAEARVDAHASTPLFDALWSAPAEADPLGFSPEPLPQYRDDDYDYDARARSRTYLRLSGGVVTTTDSDGPDEDIEFDEGYLIGVALGRRFGEGDQPLGFALELEGLWTDQDADDGNTLDPVRDVNTLSALLNGLITFRLTDSFGLYGGAGIGAAWVDVGTSSDALNDFDSEDGAFLTWQLRAGLEFWASRAWGINLGYRFVNIDDVEINDDVGSENFELETRQHVLELGVSFSF